MIEYFRDLTEEELLKFESFIYSPYFTSHKNNIRLYHYLRKLYPVITEEDISKENLSLHIYGEKRVNEVKIRKLTSEFFTLMEKFFIQTELENDTVRNKIILLGSLRKRG